MSWLGARKVFVPNGEAVPLGVTDGAAGEAGALDDPAAGGDPTGVGDPAGALAARAAVELADELQAVTSKAAQASPAQDSPARDSPARDSTAPAAAGRDFRDFEVNIDSYLFNFQ